MKVNVDSATMSGIDMIESIKSSGDRKWVL